MVEKELTEQNGEQTMKVVLTWSQVILLGFLVSLVAYHAQSGNPVALAILGIMTFFTSAVSIISLIRALGTSYNLVMGVMMKEPNCVNAVTLLYPLTWPRIANALVYGGVAAYMVQVGMWPVAVIAIVPTALSFFVYNRISALANNPEVQKVAAQEIKFLDEQGQRNAILNEELEKVMPVVLERANERFKELNISLENIEDESEERIEQDQGSVSNSDKDERS